MDKPLYITYYTKGTIYEEVFKTTLLPSLEKWGLDYHAYEIEDTGQWHTNARLKPQIIKRALEEFPDRNIVWIDSDASIEKYPHKIDMINKLRTADLATHWLSWEKHYGRDTDKGKFEMLDGTVYFRNTQDIRDFVDLWIKAQGTNDHQKTLARMLRGNDDVFANPNKSIAHCGCLGMGFSLPNKNMRRIHFDLDDLGWEYCYIATRPNGEPPAFPLENPVIVHHQASRIAKRSLH